MVKVKRQLRMNNAMVRHGLGLLLLIFVGFVNYFLEPEFRTSFLYLIPVVFIAWTDGLKSGLLFSLMAATIWLRLNVFIYPIYNSISAAYWNGILVSLHYILAAYLVSKVRDQTLLLESHASTDPLTNVLNRRAFYQRLEEEIARSKRYGQTFSIAFLDLDDFKSINDTYGHKAGDDLLLSLSQSIKSMIRSTDRFGRIGGDEFAILFPETRQEQVMVVMENIFQRVLGNRNGNGRMISFSAGVISCSDQACEIDELMSHLDHLMYEAKKNGKGLINYATLPVPQAPH